MFKYKNEAELTAMSAAERDTYAENKRVHEAGLNKQMIEDAVKGMFTETQLATKLEELGLTTEKMTDLKETIKNQAAQIQKLNDEGVGSKEPATIKGEVTKWAEENKAVIEAIKGGANVSIPTISISKAAITMTIATSTGSSVYLPNAQVQPGIVDLVRQQPSFWDLMPKTYAKANPLVWVNKTNKQGNAAFIGEGVLKPLASFELSTESSTPKKVAERFKVSTEMLYDIERLASYIEDEIMYEVKIAASTQILTGTASSTNPKGATTYGAPYSLTTIKTPNPNNFDAIRAAKAQLRSLYFERNIVALINPIDAANMDLAKATTSGVYMLPPFSTADGQMIKGTPIIESDQIPVGYLFMFDMSKYHIVIHQDFFVAWGWENDDFSKNLVTAIGEIRFHQYVSANEVGGFLYDTFANIKTLLTPA